MSKKSFTSKALHVEFPKADPHRALQIPIYESVAFDFDTAENIAANFRGEYPAHVYSRTSNPTVEYLERKLKALTGAYQALAVSSGMASISSSILALCKSGDNIISAKHLFGHTYALFNQTLPPFGIETRFCNTQDIRSIEPLIDANTRAIYFETVTNPQLEIANIVELSSLANKHGIPLICDSTLTPPAIFQSAALGVDIEVMSTTKYISGGATSIGGIVLDNGTYDWSKNPNLKMYVEKFGKDAFIAKLRKNIYRNFGPCMTAHAAYFQILGLDILELRLERSYQNCMALGVYLGKHLKVASVNYPGLPSSEFYQLAISQFSGKPGTIMTFDLETEEACMKFMNKLQMIRRATNLNDNKSLIIHPYSTIYAEFPPEARAAMNIRPTTMRLSVGIEGAEDLIDDIAQALQ
jgi:O-acetylhomoserine (thiol)-lyase